MTRTGWKASSASPSGKRASPGRDGTGPRRLFRRAQIEVLGPHQGGQEAVAPTGNVIAQKRRIERLVPVLALQQRHGERTVDSGSHGIRIVRINQQGTFLELRRRTGEARQ